MIIVIVLLAIFALIGGAYYYYSTKYVKANGAGADGPGAVGTDGGGTDGAAKPPAAVLTPINCNVSEWSTWGDCSKACGGGEQKRTRTVKTAAANGGAECGALSESQSCNEQGCPINCEMSEWGGWSGCSNECGGGTQERTRSVTTAAANGGTECVGALNEIQACNEQSCLPEYALGSSNSLDCPSDYSPLMDQNKCQEIHSNYRDSFLVEDNAGYPSGCYAYNNGNVYYNKNADNTAVAGAERICGLA
jgi:hypothetical protein